MGNGLSKGAKTNVSSALHSADGPPFFCVPVLFLYLCLLWVYVFFGFYVGPAKLQCGATPPSVMVFFLWRKNDKYHVWLPSTFKDPVLSLTTSPAVPQLLPPMGKS